MEGGSVGSSINPNAAAQTQLRAERPAAQPGPQQAQANQDQGQQTPQPVVNAQGQRTGRIVNIT
jgi:hypothetical protein